MASELAATTVANHVKTLGALDFDRDMAAILHQANDVIMAYVAENPNCRGMGTTIVVVQIIDKQLKMINVGDSRCYGVSKEGLTQLSKDHSLVAELVKIGSITAEEAESHPDKNIITSALGVDKTFEMFQGSFDLAPYDAILICSDGLTNMVTTDAIHHVFVNEAIEDVPQKLIDMANDNGGKDNITVVCIEI